MTKISLFELLKNIQNHLVTYKAVAYKKIVDATWYLEDLFF